MYRTTPAGGTIAYQEVHVFPRPALIGGRSTRLTMVPLESEPHGGPGNRADGCPERTPARLVATQARVGIAAVEPAGSRKWLPDRTASDPKSRDEPSIQQMAEEGGSIASQPPATRSRTLT